MAGPTVNTYTSLDEDLKLKRTLPVKSTTSDNLYATLMMTKENKAWRKDSNRVKDILSPSSTEQLREVDKERIRLALDNLRIRWLDVSKLKGLLTKDDFDKIKERQSSSGRTEALINIIIEKSWFKDSKDEILERTDAMLAWKNAEVGNEVAEKLALKRISVNRYRHYWAKIQKVIDDNTDNSWVIDWSECYIDVIKYANYATINLLRRTGTRYIVPAKFWWRDIPKQTQRTLDALRDRIETSDNEAEIFAIEYIRNNLQKAFDYYKSNLWPSNADFDKARLENEERMYAENKSKKKKKKKKRK